MMIATQNSLQQTIDDKNYSDNEFDQDRMQGDMMWFADQEESCIGFVKSNQISEREHVFATHITHRTGITEVWWYNILTRRVK